MAFLTAIVGMLDAAGDRVDAAAADGTYRPIYLQTGTGVAASSAVDGETSIVTLAADTATIATVASVAALARGVVIRESFQTAAASARQAVFYNDTGAAVALGSLAFVPTDAIAVSDTDYWEAAWVLGTAPTTPVREVTSQLTGGVAFVAGEAIPVSGTVTIPAGVTLVCRLQRNGSATTMGGLFQGRLA